MTSFLKTFLILLMLAPATAFAEDKKEPAVDSGSVELLFTQSAHVMRFEGDTLTLGGIGPATLYFADRPQRLVGLMSHQAFVKLWHEGKNSFNADPPNAALAILDETEKPPVALELLSVTLEGEELIYKVRVLEGEVPAESGPVSLFIDHHHHHWRGFGMGWGPGFGPWGPGFGPEWDSGFGRDSFGCGSNGLFGSAHLCF